MDGWTVAGETLEQVRELVDDGVTFALASAAEDRGEAFDEAPFAGVTVEHYVTGRLYYRGEEYTQNGARCRRLVVLAPTPRSGEPAAKEIITTFGAFIAYTTP